MFVIILILFQNRLMNISMLPRNNYRLNIRLISSCTASTKKKARERAVIIADEQARKIIGDRLLENEFWNISNYFIFDKLVKKIAKEQFGEQTVKIYKVNSFKSGYEDLKKCDIISSHAFRRYAAARNISKYGIDVARTMGGQSDFQVITRHYAEFMDKEDLKDKLLGKKQN